MIDYIRARWMRFRSEIVYAEASNESHCDQCDLQAVCELLHGKKGRKCKSFPLIYKRK